jgi:hypothetical protein
VNSWLSDESNAADEKKKAITLRNSWAQATVFFSRGRYLFQVGFIGYRRMSLKFFNNLFVECCYISCTLNYLWIGANIEVFRLILSIKHRQTLSLWEKRIHFIINVASIDYTQLALHLRNSSGRTSSLIAAAIAKEPAATTVAAAAAAVTAIEAVISAGTATVIATAAIIVAELSTTAWFVDLPETPLVARVVIVVVVAAVAGTMTMTADVAYATTTASAAATLEYNSQNLQFSQSFPYR